jgi:protein-S-isoprenylcysteine O-methyltransferase Ste14
MKWLELRIPPPVLALICAAIMWALAEYTPHYATTPTVKWGFVIFFIVLGATFDIAGLLAFKRSKTTINPLHPEKSSTLVSDGIYKITRNPMYVGMVAFLLAWMSYLENSTALIAVFLFMWYITTFQIIPEEQMLTQLFGEDFVEYQKRVRRWL